MGMIQIEHPRTNINIPETAPCVLALGFFDGVHKGHQKLLTTARQIAREQHLVFGVMTFYPHPREVIQPGPQQMKYITPLDVKIDIFRELGVEKLFIINFDEAFSQLSTEEFVEEYIVGMNCKHVVGGFDYHYGYKGKGNMQMLAKQGIGKFDVSVIEKVEHDCEKVSSTLIRQLLSLGKVETIPYKTGDYYEVKGNMVSEILNDNKNWYAKIIVEDDYLMPYPGRYQVQVEVDGNVFDGVCSRIWETNQSRSILVQFSEPLGYLQNRTVKVKWIRSLFQEQNEINIISQFNGIG